MPPAENIEILVHLARHNKIFGELARMTLAGWDEKACLDSASDPQTSAEVLEYFISPENLRPKLLPALLENPSVSEGELAKLALGALRETIAAMLTSARVRSLTGVLTILKTNPYLKKEEAAEIDQLLSATASTNAVAAADETADAGQVASGAELSAEEVAGAQADSAAEPAATGEQDEKVSAYLKEHADEIAAEGEKPFQSIGGVVELLGPDYFPVTQRADVPAPVAASPATAALKPGVAVAKRARPGESERKNTLQKINALDVKGRIQLALKGNKEERSILIRDGTKVVALAVLDAPKLSDGEVEQIASQKNVLEAVLRQIPLKRRFVKNYIVVRNLVANPRTPIDLGLGLMKYLLAQDLKNLSANKEVSDTIRKLALKMYKQKVESANKK
ncbi:conserved hypothetical protein [Candidatus Sulfotelmatobacter kueseliae]|uniref:Uncharacterized protein n=1 Tax=Candidatus Sulfotelmatobacter kueseliae TaxID=2042962 RepID=A0A2U3KAX0_9BACT|nr:conserved hypothetical protein [Candidatus Sulfotelmatobacter kueseliae]